MRSWLAVLMVITAVATWQLVAAHPASADEPDCDNIVINLVQDCGFEALSLSPDWMVGTPGTDVAVGTTSPHSEAQYAELGTNSGTNTLSQTLTGAAAGTEYALTFYLANTGTGGFTNSFMFDVQNTSNATIHVTTQNNAAAFSYTEYTATFIATAVQPALVMTERNDDGVWEVDDVSVVPISQCDALGSDNLVQNCGFEQGVDGVGEPTDWTLTPAASGSFVRVGGIDPPHSGASEMEFGAENGIDDTITQTLTTAQSGRTYHLSFWVACLGGDDFTATIDDVAGPNTDQSVFTASSGCTSGYAEHSADFTAGATAPTLVFAGRDPKTWVDLDDVVVQADYDVTFNVQGGQPLPLDQTVLSGGTATEPTPPTKAGLIFAGWSDHADGALGSTWDFSSFTVEHDLVLYAQFVPASECDAVAGNLVQDCGFEKGALSGPWTAVPAAAGADFGVDRSGATGHSGLHILSFGATSTEDDLVSQSIATTAGTTYDLSFWLSHDSPSDPSAVAPDFSADVAGTAAGTLSVLNELDPGLFTYAETRQTFTAAGSSVTLEFRSRSQDGWFSLDDVAIVAAPPGPPPAPTVTVASSANPTVPGASLTFTATVSPVPSCGSITWLVDNAPTPATATGSGSTYTLGPVSGLSTGTHVVTAAYSGCSSASATSGTVIEQVGTSAPPASPTPSPTASSSPPPKVTNPTIKAHISSAAGRHHGWYAGPVQISYTCTPGSTPLSASCPDPVTLTKDGAKQKVTVTVADTDGGMSTRTITVSIDQTAPKLTVKPRKGKCEATDATSGVASCTFHRHRTTRHGVTILHWSAKATDKAGNTTTKTGHYT
ncbi:MAG TPA: InlB B-repeat-containing protein [Mycobacteriales bacterium]|nr:InlB B-repeat-containing protein [Mycobacteriales bacterium]